MTYIIFGGAGFAGLHYAETILHHDNLTPIILADIKSVQLDYTFPAVTQAIAQGNVKYQYCDVRDRSTFSNLPRCGIDLILNFAAVHREPGHEHHEYYDTNIPGAQNVCAYAEEVGCKQIVFTSSIAVYEPTKKQKDEGTIPAPVSSYGGSKLAAELIHQKWQGKDPDNRKLVIVRPGVVYGPAEGGNVTRMIKMIKRGLFVFVGNRDTRKASIYVKELISIIQHLLARPERLLVANAVVPTPPSMQEYVEAVNKATGWHRRIPALPYPFIYAISFLVAPIRPIAKKTGIDPVRVKKLRRINNIVTKTLPETGYRYKYTLESAFADWHSECIDDWTV